MGSTETDNEIIKRMGVNVAVIAVVIFTLIFVSYAIDPF